MYRNMELANEDENASFDLAYVSGPQETDRNGVDGPRLGPSNLDVWAAVAPPLESRPSLLGDMETPEASIEHGCSVEETSNDNAIWEIEPQYNQVFPYHPSKPILDSSRLPSPFDRRWSQELPVSTIITAPFPRYDVPAESSIELLENGLPSRIVADPTDFSLSTFDYHAGVLPSHLRHPPGSPYQDLPNGTAGRAIMSSNSIQTAQPIWPPQSSTLVPIPTASTNVRWNCHPFAGPSGNGSLHQPANLQISNRPLPQEPLTINTNKFEYYSQPTLSSYPMSAPPTNRSNEYQKAFQLQWPPASDTLGRKRRNTLSHFEPPTSVDTATTSQQAPRPKRGHLPGAGSGDEDGRRKPDTSDSSTFQTYVPQGRRKKPKSDPNAPLKPHSAYVTFGREIRHRLQEEDRGFGDISKIIGQEWRNLSSKEKGKMNEGAAKAKAKYRAAMKIYEETPEYGQHRLYLGQFHAADNE